MVIDEPAHSSPGIVGLSLVFGSLAVEEAVRGVRLYDYLLLDAGGLKGIAELLDRSHRNGLIRAAEDP